jgi:hypothetical protein
LCSEGRRPVKIEAWDGGVQGAFARASVKAVPSAASPSRFGVTLRPPPQPVWSLRTVSRMTRMTFGRAGSREQPDPRSSADRRVIPTVAMNAWLRPDMWSASPSMVATYVR